MTITYRQAAVADAAAIDGVFRQSFIDTFAHLYRTEDLETFLSNFTREAWEAELGDERFRVRIAESDGRPVGYVKLGPPSLDVSRNRPAVEIRQFYVLDEWRGAGIAHALMYWAMADARTSGATEIYLTVYSDNHRARRFYQRYGFEEVGPYKFMVGEQADEDVIMKVLV
jgi:ribosomal protein S18 acetylase RimI-like enzyme